MKMAIILEQKLDSVHGVTLEKGDDGFYVFSTHCGQGTRVFVYKGNGTTELHQALATYELELSYIFTAELEG